MKALFWKLPPENEVLVWLTWHRFPFQIWSWGRSVKTVLEHSCPGEWSWRAQVVFFLNKGHSERMKANTSKSSQSSLSCWIAYWFGLERLPWTPGCLHQSYRRSASVCVRARACVRVCGSTVHGQFCFNTLNQLTWLGFDVSDYHRMRRAVAEEIKTLTRVWRKVQLVWRAVLLPPLLLDSDSYQENNKPPTSVTFFLVFYLRWEETSAL